MRGQAAATCRYSHTCSARWLRSGHGQEGQGGSGRLWLLFCWLDLVQVNAVSGNISFAQLQAYLAQFVRPFSDAEWSHIASTITLRRLRKGEKLLKAPEVNHYIAFVNSGALRTFYNRDGNDTTFFFFFENSLVTEYDSFLTQRESQFSIEAIEDCELLVLHSNDLQHLYQNVTDGQLVGRLVAQHLYVLLQRRTASLLFETAEQRYRHLVSSNSPILQRVNQYHIASYLGVKPQSLSRIRKRL